MTLYGGARSNLTLSDVLELGSGWRVQPKLDGCYAVAMLNELGQVTQVLSRTGRPYSADVHQLADECIGAPDSVLIGELTAHTERGRQEATELGYTMLRLFDAAAIGGQDISGLPYAKRRELLQRMHAKLGASTSGRPWDLGRDGRPHHRRSGQWMARTTRSYATATGLDGRPTRRLVNERAPAQSWRRAPVLEQYPVAMAKELWDRTACGEIEGLVAVAQTARLGARASKRKCKPVHTLDCRVISVDASGKACSAVLPSGREHGMAVFQRGHRFVLSCIGSGVVVGDLVEVRHEGYYQDGRTPRFPRIVRARLDMAA